MMQPRTYTDKLQAFKSLLTLVALVTFALTVLNIVSGSKILAVFQFTLSLVSTFIVVKFKQLSSENHFKIISHVLLFAIFSTMTYSFWLKGQAAIIFIWCVVIPILSYQLSTLKSGFWITALFLLVSAVIFMHHHIIDKPDFNDIQISSAILCVLSVWMLTHAYEKSHITKHNNLRDMATHDTLTSLRNRTTLQAVFDECKTEPVGLIMLDADNFKYINDNYGHDVGDQVLVSVAECLRDHVANRDFVFRLGGEEFCVIMPKARMEDIGALGNKLIKHISYLKTPAGNEMIQYTASAGAAYYPQDANNLSDLLKVADARLYHSKKNGKNRSTFMPSHDDSDELSA